jgi:hypothetical protein
MFKQDQLVVEWGFPANEPLLSESISLIRSWVGSGVSHWWFDGDRAAARASFLRRGTLPETSRGIGLGMAWDLQVGEINRNWQKVEGLFPPERRLHVIKAGPIYHPAQEIFATIFS